MAAGSIWLPFSLYIWRTNIKLPHYCSFPGKVADSLSRSSENLPSHREVIFMGLAPSPSCPHSLKLHGFLLGLVCWWVLSSKGRTSRRVGCVFLYWPARACSYLMGDPFWCEPRSEFILGKTRAGSCSALGGGSSLSLNHQMLLPLQWGKEYLFLCFGAFYGLFFSFPRKKFAQNMETVRYFWSSCWINYLLCWNLGHF